MIHNGDIGTILRIHSSHALRELLARVDGDPVLDYHTPHHHADALPPSFSRVLYDLLSYCLSSIYVIRIPITRGIMIASR